DVRGHLDHVGALSKLGVEVPAYIAQPDAGYLTGERSPPMSNHKGLFQRLTAPLVSTPDVPIRVVHDGDRIGGFTAYRTPGHTLGHTVYAHEDHGVAFLGDLVHTRKGHLATSPWIVTADSAKNRESIRHLAGRIPRFDVAAVGHGNPVETDGRSALGHLADRL
ncbi:MAG: MBL fold metallo-hydrolase, partial [Halobacteriota archaeon]